jgi:Tfp pilus assembly PilM family ATPase
VANGERVLYLNVDGLTNVAIAEGTVCRFTRVLGGGVEELASQLAERRAIPLEHARGLLADVDLAAPTSADAPAGTPPEPAAEPGDAASAVADDVVELASEPHDAAPQPEHQPADEPPQAVQGESERARSYTEELAASSSPTPAQEARAVVESGVRAIAGEVRNSLDFHRSQEGGAEVSRVVLSGSALELAGFAQALQASLGVEVVAETVGVSDRSQVHGLSPHRLAVATGLAISEIAR